MKETTQVDFLALSLSRDFFTSYSFTVQCHVPKLTKIIQGSFVFSPRQNSPGTQLRLNLRLLVLYRVDT